MVSYIHHPLHNYHKYIKQIKLFRVGFLLWVFSTEVDKTLYQIQLRTFLWVHSRCPLPLGSAVFCWSSASQPILLFPQTLQLCSFTVEGCRGIVQNEPGHPLASQALTQNRKEHTRTLLQPTYSNSHHLSGCVVWVGGGGGGGRNTVSDVCSLFYFTHSLNFCWESWGPSGDQLLQGRQASPVPFPFAMCFLHTPRPAPSLPTPTAPVCFNALWQFNALAPASHRAHVHMVLFLPQSHWELVMCFIGFYFLLAMQVPDPSWQFSSGLLRPEQSRWHGSHRSLTVEKHLLAWCSELTAKAVSSVSAWPVTMTWVF